MKSLELTAGAGLFIDIGQSSLRAVRGHDAFAFPIERAENGRLTDLCRERLTEGLRGFLSQKARAAGQNALCAIGARGVSMRRLTLPASSEEELQRVLRLQIESEFPLSPDELAWGSRLIGAPKPGGNGGPARQELLVVAVKKEVLEEYSGILTACGVTPVFTLAALARAELHPPPAGSCAVLDIGRTHSELISFDNGIPASLRILAWGGENITRSIQEKLGVSHDEAEKIKLTLDQPGDAVRSQAALLQSATESALAALAKGLKPATLGAKLYLTGKSARDPRLAPCLAGLLGGAVACECLELPEGTGASTVLSGLVKAGGRNSASPLLVLQISAAQKAVRPARPAIWKWAAAAVLLALLTLFFPYAEAMMLKPFLEKKLAALQADRGRLTTIDRELDFLKFLKQNQPPYLDAIYLLARSAPGGTHLESISMGRHQEMSIRLKLGNTSQVTDFRSKLNDSGWFTNVVVEEQAPSPDRRVSVRMTAALKPAESRKPITAEPPGKKVDKSNTGDMPDFGLPMPEPVIMPSSPPVEVAPAPPTDEPPPAPSPPVRKRPRRPIVVPPDP
jgi:type IV pilus assembly protein PilM